MVKKLVMVAVLLVLVAGLAALITIDFGTRPITKAEHPHLPDQRHWQMFTDFRSVCTRAVPEADSGSIKMQAGSEAAGK